MKTINFILLATVLLGTISCKRKYDEPPVQTIPVGNIVTISDIKQMYNDAGSAITFTEDYSLYATAVSDESSGNFYKEVYVQDDSSAIQLRLDFGGGIYEGDSVRVALKGTTIDVYRGMFQLSDVDVDNNIVKQATEKHVAPMVLTIPEIATDLLKYQGMLVQINDVEFKQDDLFQTWSDAVNQSDVNHSILDCNLSELIVRTSGYANFASDTVPSGNGNLIAIVAIYTTETNPSNWTWDEAQLYIRNTDELTISDNISDRCTSSGIQPYLSKNFDDESITSGGWTTQSVLGSLNWEIGTVGGSYANMTNYNGSTKEDNEAWLISPTVDLSSASTPSFSFRNAYNYTGNAVEVYVSASYTGDVTTTSWTAVPATLSQGGWDWVSSGNQNFSGYVGGQVTVAFKYTGTTTAGSTWEIDDIKIEEL